MLCLHADKCCSCSRAASEHLEAIIDLLNASAGGGGTGATKVAELPPLLEIMDNTKHLCTKKRCTKGISNVTKLLLWHINLVKNQGVALCTAIIPTNHKSRYLDPS